MNLFVVVLLKRTIYNKETEREAENEGRENERSQNEHKKALTADSAPDPSFIRIIEGSASFVCMTNWGRGLEKFKNPCFRFTSRFLIY